MAKPAGKFSYSHEYEGFLTLNLGLSLGNPVLLNSNFLKKTQHTPRDLNFLCKKKLQFHKHLDVQ